MDSLLKMEWWRLLLGPGSSICIPLSLQRFCLQHPNSVQEILCLWPFYPRSLEATESFQDGLKELPGRQLLQAFRDFFFFPRRDRHRSTVRELWGPSAPQTVATCPNKWDGSYGEYAIFNIGLLIRQIAIFMYETSSIFILGWFGLYLSSETSCWKWTKSPHDVWVFSLKLTLKYTCPNGPDIFPA